MTRIKSIKVKQGYQHRQHRKIQKDKERHSHLYKLLLKKDKKILKKNV